MGKQDSINTILLGRNKSVWALGKERVKSRVQWRNKNTCAVPLLLHLVIVLCLCECVCAKEESEEKINEEGTSTSNSTVLCIRRARSKKLRYCNS